MIVLPILWGVWALGIGLLLLQQSKLVTAVQESRTPLPALTLKQIEAFYLVVFEFPLLPAGVGCQHKPACRLSDKCKYRWDLQNYLHICIFQHLKHKTRATNYNPKQSFPQILSNLHQGMFFVTLAQGGAMCLTFFTIKLRFRLQECYDF